MGLIYGLIVVLVRFLYILLSRWLGILVFVLVSFFLWIWVSVWKLLLNFVYFVNGVGSVKCFMGFDGVGGNFCIWLFFGLIEWLLCLLFRLNDVLLLLFWVLGWGCLGRFGGCLFVCCLDGVIVEVMLLLLDLLFEMMIDGWLLLFCSMNFGFMWRRYLWKLFGILLKYLENVLIWDWVWLLNVLREIEIFFFMLLGIFGRLLSCFFVLLRSWVIVCLILGRFVKLV